MDPRAVGWIPGLWDGSQDCGMDPRAVGCIPGLWDGSQGCGVDPRIVRQQERVRLGMFMSDRATLIELISLIATQRTALISRCDTHG